MSEDLKIKAELHQHITRADLKKLKETVDRYQRSLLSFDDPSLLLLAIEVYLDPSNLVNAEFQLEVILFLIKCGVHLWTPGGNILLYIYNWCVKEKIHTDEEFEEKLTELCNLLIEHGQTQLLLFKVPDMETLSSFQSYMKRQWAAFKIQSCWRSYYIKSKSVVH